MSAREARRLAEHDVGFARFAAAGIGPARHDQVGEAVAVHVVPAAATEKPL